MTDFYVNPAIGNDTNNGLGNTPAQAWATLQKAIDTVVGGDTVYLVSAGSGNDETPLLEIDFDGATGTPATPVCFIGVNSSGVDDGTRYVIDGGLLGAGLSLFKFYTTGSYYFFKNIELNNAKDNACELAGAGTYPLLFTNCVFHGSTNSAIDSYGKGCVFYRCRFSSNGANGCFRPWTMQFIFCVFKDNTLEGVRVYHADTSYLHCIFHNNGGNGGLYFENSSCFACVFGCVFDGNAGDGIGTAAVGGPSIFASIIGNRFTNNGGLGMDINFANGIHMEDFNLFLNNGGGVKAGNIIEGGNSLTSGTEGYTNRAADDFSLTSSASLRRTKVTIP